MHRRFMTFSLLFTLLASSVTVLGAEPARDLWMSGFAKYKEGVEAEKAGNEPLALRLFQEAVQDLQKARTDYPDWQPAVVSFRLQECSAKIATLKTRLVEIEEDLPAEKLLALNRTLRAEVNEYQDKLAQAQEALLKAQAAPRAPADIQDKLAALEAENKALAAELADTGTGSDRKVKRLEEKIIGLKQEVETLDNAVKDGEEALGAANREIARSETLRKEIGGLKDIALELEKSLAQMAREKEALRGELNSLLAERKSMAGDVQQLADQLKALEQTSEKLREQNDALRKQLK